MSLADATLRRKETVAGPRLVMSAIGAPAEPGGLDCAPATPITIANWMKRAAAAAGSASRPSAPELPLISQVMQGGVLADATRFLHNSDPGNAYAVT